MADKIFLNESQLNDISKREQKSAAFHEAGHAAVCRRFGGMGDAEIWSNPGSNTDLYQKAWLGNFKMYVSPGVISFESDARKLLDIVDFPDNWQVIYGLAGVVAECVFCHDEAEPWVIEEYISDLINQGAISKTDLNSIGESWTIDDVTDTVKLLLSMRERIEMEADCLIRKSQ